MSQQDKEDASIKAYLGVDALSISAHKFSGPKGIGALFLKEKHTINPLIDGGGQERQNRAGTENVPNIVGFGKAIELAEKNRLKFCEHTLSLKMEFINQIKKDFREIIFHTEIEESLPNIINFSIPNIHGEPIVESPEDAISTFIRTGLKHMVFNDTILISKHEPNLK